MPSKVISIPALMPGDILLTSLSGDAGEKQRAAGSKFTHAVLVLSPTIRGETLSPDGNWICSRKILTNDTQCIEHLEGAVDAVVLRLKKPHGTPSKDFVRDCIIHALADSGRPYPIKALLDSGEIKDRLAKRLLERDLRRQKNAIFSGRICSANVAGILLSAGVTAVDVPDEVALRRVIPDDLANSPFLEPVNDAILTLDVADGSWKPMDGFEDGTYGLDGEQIHDIIASGKLATDAAASDEAKDRLKEQTAKNLGDFLSGQIEAILKALRPILQREQELGWVK